MEEPACPGDVSELTVLSGRYRLGARLGPGGMGEVWEAHDLELERRVALELSPRRRVRDARWVELFMAQARALARIDHPGVVRVFDRGLHAGTLPYLVMEYLVGRDLAQLLRVHGRLDLERAVTLGEQLASALAGAHAADVLHRDLRLRNVVLLADARARPRLRLIGFTAETPGGAVELDGGLAPELLDAGAQASASSDVYALGCMLFELTSGRPPFHASTRSELMRAIRDDAPSSPRSLNEALPRALDALILHMLAKDPGARPSALAVCEGLAQLGGIESSGWAPPRASCPRSGDVLAQRFELGQKLGEGRTGVVFEALDRQHGSAVALKVLRQQSPDDLYRLKREYRTLQEIAHPNIVQIQGLFLDESVAFLTMELLSGPSFMVLAADPSAREPLLLQLARGLATLHGRGLTHRDLKPSNIRVAGPGRVVLLDFGLTVEDSSHTVIAGTPPYVAPEVLDGVIGPAADLYALGVIVHELLCGEPPGERPLESRGELPRRLTKLCTRLLARDPGARPSADEVVRQLEHAERGSPPTRAGSLRPRPFVGREAELSELLAAAECTAADGRTRTVLVRGASGIGKTMLVEQLALRLPPPTLALIGRCREAEAIPYPALDSAIDALSEHLLRLPALVLRYLLPRDAATLPLLFPVLRRVDALADALPSASLPLDPLEIRTRAFRAFKELLRRLADQHPLVLVVDDVQWIDPDSAALLAYCFADPEPAPALLVLALREDGGVNAQLERTLATLPAQPHVLALTSFTRDAAAQLARTLLSEHAPRALVERISSQSGGHPFLLTVLVEHAQHPERSRGTLEEALRARVLALSPAARRLLELVAICRRPLPRALYLSLLEGEGPSLLHTLRRERLLQRHEARDGTLLDVYHARVRDSVLALLPRERLRAHHALLAGALAGHEQLAEAQVEHLEGAAASRKPLPSRCAPRPWRTACWRSSAPPRCTRPRRSYARATSTPPCSCSSARRTRCAARAGCAGRACGCGARRGSRRAKRGPGCSSRQAGSCCSPAISPGACRCSRRCWRRTPSPCLPPRRKRWR